MTQSVATRQRWLLVLLLFLHTVNTYLDRVCISAAKGPMQADISGLSDQMMGYAFGIFAFGYALFQVPAGWFSDRAGRDRRQVPHHSSISCAALRFTSLD